MQGTVFSLVSVELANMLSGYLKTEQSSAFEMLVMKYCVKFGRISTSETSKHLWEDGGRD